MVPYLRAANVKDGFLDLSDVKQMNFAPAERRVFSLRPGDVLVTEGSGSLGSVGASAVWRGEIDGPVCFQNTLLRMRPREGATDGRFLEWWARSAFGSGLFASVATGANIYHISAERVRALPIEVPSMEEQRRIADFLDAETARIDALLEARDRQRDLLTLHAASSLNDVTERLSRKYGTVRLRRVLMSMEQGWSPQCEDRYVGDGEWGVVKAGCVNSGRFDAMQHKALPPNVEPRKEYKLRNGDLLMSRASGSPELIGSIGIVEELDHQLLLCDKVYRLRVDRTRALAPFIARALRCHSVREHIKLGISGAEGMANNLPTAVVMGCLIPDAPLAAQKDVVAEREQEEGTVKRMRASIGRASSLLAERRQALITAAVTGQLDVTTAGRAAAV
ncbi:restriction endonuclease subunit S [Streptomyces sp. NBC_01546]|uniref:restriction endonuclease subunit S n=1 Tax=Streptomyces sp. NBC_01546 TaxID=2975872 RepID=UPI0038707D90